MNVWAFLEDVSVWARSQPDVRGVALVGSHARGTAIESSDIDLVVLSDDPERLMDGSWADSFGSVASIETEDYGALRSLRVRYEDGREVEFGVSAPVWAAVPLDAGTERVLADGVRILYDPDGMIRRAKDAAVA